MSKNAKPQCSWPCVSVAMGLLLAAGAAVRQSGRSSPPVPVPVPALVDHWRCWSDPLYSELFLTADHRFTERNTTSSPNGGFHRTSTEGAWIASRSILILRPDISGNRTVRLGFEFDQRDRMTLSDPETRASARTCERVRRIPFRPGNRPWESPR